MTQLNATAANFNAFMERLRAAYPDYEDDDLFDTADGETGLTEGIERVLRRIALDEAMVDGIKAHKTDLDARKKRLEQRVSTLRGAILSTLEDVGQKRLELPAATLSVGTRKPGVVISDEEAIPSDFFKSKPVLDKAYLKEVLDHGEPVPGASLDNGGSTLTIRRA